MDLHTTPAHPAGDISTTTLGRSRIFPWVVFALTFGLLLSDYMSRQVLPAVFPYLKTQWGLSDSRLGALTSVVALMVALGTVPLSLLADRWGRVRSLLIMASFWSVATLLCACAGNFGQMLGARFLLGVGEAAYGSVGAAVVVGVFAPRLRASVSGAFLAGGSFGSVLGIALGGVIARHIGWRWTFVAMAVFGLLLVAAFRLFVTEHRLQRHHIPDDATAENDSEPGTRVPLSSLFSTVPVWCVYLAGGLQLFVSAVLMAWLPSFFNRSYGMAPDRAGLTAAVYALLIGVGMIGCGMIADRVARAEPARLWSVVAVYCVASIVLLTLAFSLPTGPAQLIALGIGALFCAGSTGAISSLVINLTHPSLRATAFGTAVLFNNIFGLAAGPLLVGFLADHYGLATALRLVPLAYLGVLVVTILGRRAHPSGRHRLVRSQAVSSSAPPAPSADS
ncbi:MFS transporter [Nocardia africana]|uniref:L-galactonate transporter n=1 Tax=Nocardia africana TaxID=134964 RepID=A0A378WZB4_9NOCA|nr:MFS transporter [Nocardia africana]MCC3312916.1 MFS transporter [Nocardia africana]SUA45744.1 L-galactonate transporter [Nocardia africana]